MNTRTFALLMILGVFAGCSSVRHTATGETIYFTGTRAYQHKVQTLALTVEQARERVATHLAATRPPPASPKLGYLIVIHQVLVGDCFVFAMPHKADIILSGYYVDGHTGVVTERQDGRTHYPKKT